MPSHFMRQLGICSFDDEMRDAMFEVFRKRFEMQLEIFDTETDLREWRLPKF